MKIFLILPLLILMAACGTSAQTELPATATATEAASSPAESSMPAPSPTPLAQSEPSPTPSPAPTEAAASPSPTAQPLDCSNKAAFYEDVTIPDGTLLKMGESFNKVWRVKNAGTCDWTDYHLVYAGGDAMNGPLTSPLPEIRSGEIENIAVDLKAPQSSGGTMGYWQFEDTAGQTFGVGAEGNGLLWVQINVAYPLPASGSSSASGPTPVPSANQVASATIPQTGQGGCVYSQNSAYESQILSLINNARSQNGLGALTLDGQLNAAAHKHSLDMACNAIVSHTGTDGSSWYTRVAAQGFANHNSARENIYVGNPAFGGDANGAFNWWMNSEIHRKTLMNPDQKLIGISYVHSDASAYGGNYTTVFARP